LAVGAGTLPYVVEVDDAVTVKVAWVTVASPAT
jgi:hypothetical protein